MNLLTLAAAGLLAVQNPEELVRTVDGKDPAASFEAIARLAALPEARRAEIEAASAKLEPFYREALLAEIKLKGELGDLFGKESRVTWKSGPKYATAHAAELATRTGLVLAPSNEPENATPFDVEFDGTFAMAALARICHEGKLRAERQAGSAQVALQPRGWEVQPFAYRNFAFFLQNAYVEKRVDFASRPAWTLRVSLSAVWDPSLPVAGWKPEARLVEATTDSGAKLEAAAAELATSFRQDEVDPMQGTVGHSSMAVALRLPAEAPAKVARLRLVATALLARSFREFALTPARPKAEDEELEATLRPEAEAGSFVVVLRPKKGTPAALAALPPDFRPAYKNSKNTQCSAGVAVKAGEVEYRVYTWSSSPEGLAPGGQIPELVSVTLRLPTSVAERPVRVELRDVPAK